MTRSYLSRPDRVGVSTSIDQGSTGCCGFNGPNASATLDKIPTSEDCKTAARRQQLVSEKKLGMQSQSGKLPPISQPGSGEAPHRRPAAKVSGHGLFGRRR